MCNVTALAPTRHIKSSNHFTSRPVGDQLVRGGQRTFLATTIIRSRGPEKIEEQTNKHEQCLGLIQSRRRVCNTTCMCRLTIAWVTSKNSTKQLECRHLLTQSSSLDLILSATVSGVDRICPWFHANSLSAPFSNQLSFASPYHFRIRRDFRSKNPLSGFAPKQTMESSAWRATYIVLQMAKSFRLMLSLLPSSSSSSSYRAGSTDIPDPLSPLLPIVHRPRQVFRTTTCILT